MTMPPEDHDPPRTCKTEAASYAHAKARLPEIADRIIDHYDHLLAAIGELHPPKI